MLRTPWLTDGAVPFAGLVLDAQGNLYGTTAYGGTPGCGGKGCGTVFKLTPAGTETVLWRFNGPPDGLLPQASLVMDAYGNLYGTTTGGGAFSAGVVFKLSPSGGETILYSFTGGADGAYPAAGLMLDAKGNLYGTTSGGGLTGSGVVFEVTP